MCWGKWGLKREGGGYDQDRSYMCMEFSKTEKTKCFFHHKKAAELLWLAKETGSLTNLSLHLPYHIYLKELDFFFPDINMHGRPRSFYQMLGNVLAKGILQSSLWKLNSITQSRAITYIFGPKFPLFNRRKTPALHWTQPYCNFKQSKPDTATVHGTEIP